VSATPTEFWLIALLSARRSLLSPRSTLDQSGVGAGRQLGGDRGEARGRGVNQGVPGKGALVLSEKTVRNHVSNIFMKLQVADRAEAIVRARDAGIAGR
jgi:hypothetical protein